MEDGGYDDGYKNCDCFWGVNPGSLVLELEKHVENYNKKRVLDLGCGEGKNSFYLANKGCIVDAYDVSKYSIENAKKLFGEKENVNIKQANVFNIDIPFDKYDIIISYGLFHCFDNLEQVEQLVKSCTRGLKYGGYLIVCAFNSRKQDLSAHDNFDPLLLSHEEYLQFFESFEIIFNTDTNLHETHPHNNIPHMHSMTRLIIKKV